MQFVLDGSSKPEVEARGRFQFTMLIRVASYRRLCYIICLTMVAACLWKTKVNITMKGSSLRTPSGVTTSSYEGIKPLSTIRRASHSR